MREGIFTPLAVACSAALSRDKAELRREMKMIAPLAALFAEQGLLARPLRWRRLPQVVTGLGADKATWLARRMEERLTSCKFDAPRMRNFIPFKLEVFQTWVGDNKS